MDVLGHLETFKTHNTLQKAAYAFIGSQLATNADRKRIDAVFRSLDSENNGRLSKKEIKDGYWKLYGKVIPDDEGFIHGSRDKAVSLGRKCHARDVGLVVLPSERIDSLALGHVEDLNLLAGAC